MTRSLKLNIIRLISRDNPETFREIPLKNPPGTALQFLTESGYKSVESIYDPRLEACRFLTEKVELDDTVVLVGAGSGYLAAETLKCSPLKIIILTCSKIIADRNQENLSALNQSRTEIEIAQFDNVEVLWEKYLRLILENFKIKIVTHTNEISLLPQYYLPLLLKIEQSRRPLNMTVSSNRILFFSAGDILEKETVSAFKNCGAEVIVIPSFQSKRLTPGSAWDLLDRYKPNLVFSINNFGSDPDGIIPHACKTAGIKWASWYLDDPRYIIDRSEHPLGFDSRDAFCWDDNGIDACTSLGFASVHSMPLAADPERFHPGKGVPELQGKVVFVGSPVFSRSKGYFAALDNEPLASEIALYFRDYILQNRTLPPQNEISAALESVGLNRTLTPESQRRFPAFCVQQANKYYRTFILNSIADLGLVVFGKGWEPLLPETVEFNPPLDYYGNLPEVYRSDSIHLSLTNLQMRSHPNQRIFDAGACGSLVLNDKLSGWNTLFSRDLDELIFDGVEDLREKIVILRNSPQKRKSLAEKLRTEVLQKHTFAHRIVKVLDCANPAMPGLKNTP